MKTVFCSECKERIYRDYYTFEDRIWCHSCVGSRRRPIETDDSGEDKAETETNASS